METIISFSGTQKGRVQIPWSVFVGASFLNLMAFGERLLILNLAIASTTLAIFYCVMLFVFWFMERFMSTGFTLNDQAQQIITAKRRTIPYQEVKRIEVHVVNDILYANARTGGMKRISFYSTSDLTEEQKLDQRSVINITFRK